jgi:uncharacterized RDD family membrane protein YckC
VEYDPQITLITPEGVELNQPLAGIGSRLAAQLVDLFLRGLIVGAALLVAALANLGGFAIALFYVSVFVALFVYDPVFEVYAHGRTLGKRAVGLRVLDHDGTPIGWRASGVRTALRVIDEFACLGVVGGIAIVVTAHSQRLGDLAGATVVVRERVAVNRELAAESLPAPDPSGASDLTGLSDSEVATVADFLARREQLIPAARRRLATSLADGLRPRVAGTLADNTDAEPFLEQVVAQRYARR